MALAVSMGEPAGIGRLWLSIARRIPVAGESDAVSLAVSGRASAANTMVFGTSSSRVMETT